MIDLHKRIERFRDYFLLRKEAEKIDVCNAILTDLDNHFFLDLEEIEALYKYFMATGYIDREVHEKVHVIVDRIISFHDRKVVNHHGNN